MGIEKGGGGQQRERGMRWREVKREGGRREWTVLWRRVQVGAGGCRRSWMCLAATSTGSTLPSPRYARGLAAELVVGCWQQLSRCTCSGPVGGVCWELDLVEREHCRVGLEALLRLSVAAKFAIGVATLGNSGAVRARGGNSIEAAVAAPG